MLNLNEQVKKEIEAMGITADVQKSTKALAAERLEWLVEFSATNLGETFARQFSEILGRLIFSRKWDAAKKKAAKSNLKKSWKTAFSKVYEGKTLCFKKDNVTIVDVVDIDPVVRIRALIDKLDQSQKINILQQLGTTLVGSLAYDEALHELLTNAGENDKHFLKAV